MHAAPHVPTAAARRNSKLHLDRIDVLRAVAIIAVFLLHWFGYAYGTDHLEWKGLMRDPSTAPAPSFMAFFPLSFGWMGVPLFFVISGFCIHASALKNNELRIGRFFWRRFWRIYPPYVAALLFAILLSDTDLTTSEGRAQLWSHLLLVHNFRADWIFALNGVFWSLAVEAQLYLLYPLLWQMRRRWGIGTALKLTLLLSVAGRIVAAGFFTHWNEELSGPVWTSPVFLWFDWTLGAFLAERYLRGARVFPINAALRWFALAVVVLSTFAKPTAIFAFSLASVFCAMAAESYLWRNQSLSRIERWLVPIGLCSYSFYLIHYPLVPVLGDQLARVPALVSPPALLLAAPIGFAAVTAISFLTYLVMERESINLGRALLLTRHRDR
ncbi:MAG: acyltransferase [Chthoniobacterales bacterium]|nr:acyltransferase [Chthoniobacterales bacterium]